MKAEARQCIRMAEEEGIENPKIVRKNGAPHPRLVGTVDGTEIVVVVCLQKNAWQYPRRTNLTRMNFRKAVRAVREGKHVHNVR